MNPGLPVGHYELRVGDDVPVDGFWSVSVYNAEGYFEPNPRGVYSINSITGVRDADGSITVRFGDHGDDAPNCIPITEGWNYLVRLYRPRPEVLDGTWTFPASTGPERPALGAVGAEHVGVGPGLGHQALHHRPEGGGVVGGVLHGRAAVPALGHRQDPAGDVEDPTGDRPRLRRSPAR